MNAPVQPACGSAGVHRRCAGTSVHHLKEDMMNKLTRREGLATIGTTVAAVALGANASKAATQVAASFDQSNIK